MGEGLEMFDGIRSEMLSGCPRHVLSRFDRRSFVWTDIEGNKHALKDIDDVYLQNIVNFLRHKVMDGLDVREDMEDALKYMNYGTAAVLKFLEGEVKRRGIKDAVPAGEPF